MPHNKTAVDLAERILEEHHGLPEAGLSNLLRWLPVLLAIQATEKDIESLGPGETASVPPVKGIRLKSRVLDYSGGAFTRRA